MLGFRAMRLGAVVAAAIAMLAAVAVPAHAQTGAVRIHVVKAGFIVGVGGGHGTLVYHGVPYRLRVGGIGIGTIGFAAADLVGTAHNLRSPADIAGTYSAVSAGFAIVGGRKVARLQNENGVVLELHGAQVGLELSLNLGGMTVALR